MILDFANDYAGQYRTKDPRRVLAVVEQALMATCERGTPRVQSIATALKGMATHVEGKDPVAAVRARIDVLDLQPGDEQLMAQIETFASTRFKEFPDTASSALAALSQNLPKDSPEHAELAEMHLGLLAEIHLGLANLWRAQIVPEEASYRGGPLRSASDHARLYADCTADKEAAARYVLEFAREIMAYEEPFSDLTAAAEILPEGSPLRDEILQEALNLHRQSERLMIGCVTKLEKLIPEHSALSPQMKTMRQQFDREEAARTDGGVPAPTFMNMHANMLQPV